MEVLPSHEEGAPRDLIAAEIEHMSVLEDSTMSFNLSQGYALKMLTGEGVWSISDRLHMYMYYTTVLYTIFRKYSPWYFNY